MQRLVVNRLLTNRKSTSRFQPWKLFSALNSPTALKSFKPTSLFSCPAVKLENRGLYSRRFDSRVKKKPLLAIKMKLTQMRSKTLFSLNIGIFLLSS